MQQKFAFYFMLVDSLISNWYNLANFKTTIFARFFFFFFFGFGSSFTENVTTIVF